MMTQFFTQTETIKEKNARNSSMIKTLFGQNILLLQWRPDPQSWMMIMMIIKSLALQKCKKKKTILERTESLFINRRGGCFRTFMSSMKLSWWSWTSSMIILFSKHHLIKIEASTSNSDASSVTCLRWASNSQIRMKKVSNGENLIACNTNYPSI